MWGVFRNLFQRSPPQGPALTPTESERDRNPGVAASIMGAAETGPKGSASACEGEHAKADYDAFCATFCFRPGTRLMEFLEAEGVTMLVSWFHWSTPNAESKAIIRLMLELMRRSENIWDQPGISLFVDGNWSHGGGPSSDSRDALSVLVQVLEKPIKVYYRQKPNDPIMVMEFRP
jgi:hypothetical protein